MVKLKYESGQSTVICLYFSGKQIFSKMDTIEAEPAARNGTGQYLLAKGRIYIMWFNYEYNHKLANLNQLEV